MKVLITPKKGTFQDATKEFEHITDWSKYYPSKDVHNVKNKVVATYKGTTDGIIFLKEL